jgi:hypothetical protein
MIFQYLLFIDLFLILISNMIKLYQGILLSSVCMLSFDAGTSAQSTLYSSLFNSAAAPETSPDYDLQEFNAPFFWNRPPTGKFDFCFSFG